MTLTLAAASQAQAPPPGQPPPPAGMAERHWPSPAERQARMAEHLATVLQLRPEQQPALQAYVAALTPPPRPEGRMDADGAPQVMTTPERLDRMLAHLDRLHARLAEVAQATRTFYAQLSPPQQRAFDVLAPMMMRHMGHGGMDHGEMGGHRDWNGAPHSAPPDGTP
jgi:protein CpxP